MTGNDFEETANAVASQSFAARLGRAAPQPPSAIDTPQVAITKEPYKAFGYLPTNGIGETCDIQSWLENSEMPQGIELQYRFLLRLEYLGDEHMKLFLPDVIVVIEGMNLRDLRAKLARRQCTYIVQYSARVWPSPPARGEAIVQKITIHRPGQAERERNSL